MRIDLQKLEKILKNQSLKDDRQKGMQPELTLGCFYGQRKDEKSVEETGIYCESCKHYENCSKYLTFARIIINPFTGARID
jgi:hypothetical protein